MYRDVSYTTIFFFVYRMSNLQYYMEDPHYRGINKWVWDIQPRVNRLIGDRLNPDAGMNTSMFLSSTGDSSVRVRPNFSDRMYIVSVNPASFDITPAQQQALEKVAEETNDPYGVLLTEMGEDRFDNTLAVKYAPYTRPRMIDDGRPHRILRTRR